MTRKPSLSHNPAAWGAGALFIIYCACSAWIVYAGHGIDFNTYYLAAHGFRSGLNPYSLGLQDFQTLATLTGVPTHTFPFGYPLLAMLLILPFTFLPPALAAFSWMLLSGMANILSVFLLGSTSKERSLSLLFLAIWVPGYVSLYAGQINSFILLLVSLTFYFWRRNKPIFAGITLCVSLLIKPLAIFLTLLLFIKKRWQELYAMFFCMIALLVIEALSFGPDLTIQQFVPNGLLLKQFSFVARPLNQSILSFLTGFISLPALAFVYFGLVLGVGAWGLCRIYRERLNMEIQASLIIILTFLLYSFTLYHDLIFLLIPVSLLMRVPEKALKSPWLIAALFTINVHGLVWHSLSAYPGLNALAALGQVAFLIAFLKIYPREGSPKNNQEQQI